MNGLYKSVLAGTTGLLTVLGAYNLSIQGTSEKPLIHDLQETTKLEYEKTEWIGSSKEKEFTKDILKTAKENNLKIEDEKDLESYFKEKDYFFDNFPTEYDGEWANSVILAPIEEKIEYNISNEGETYTKEGYVIGEPEIPSLKNYTSDQTRTRGMLLGEEFICINDEDRINKKSKRLWNTLQRHSKGDTSYYSEIINNSINTDMFDLEREKPSSEFVDEVREVELKDCINHEKFHYKAKLKNDFLTVDEKTKEVLANLYSISEIEYDNPSFNAESLLLSDYTITQGNERIEEQKNEVVESLGENFDTSDKSLKNKIIDLSSNNGSKIEDVVDKAIQEKIRNDKISF